MSVLFLFLQLNLTLFSLIINFSSENLEPHSAPLEIGHPEVGRYFSEFADTHYVANEELQTRYPEDSRETLGTVQELYQRLTPCPSSSSGSGTSSSGTQDEAPATDQNDHQAMSM